MDKKYYEIIRRGVVVGVCGISKETRDSELSYIQHIHGDPELGEISEEQFNIYGDYDWIVPISFKRFKLVTKVILVPIEV